MSFVFSVSEKHDIFVSTDIVDLQMLCIQMAASLIDTIGNMPTKGTPTQGTGKVISQYVNWADHGYINALQTMVQFVYAAIPTLSQAKLYFDDRERLLIKNAMVAYQEFKTRIVMEDQKINGRNFGSATEFVCKNWTDRNNLL